MGAYRAQTTVYVRSSLLLANASTSELLIILLNIYFSEDLVTQYDTVYRVRSEKRIILFSFDTTRNQQCKSYSKLVRSSYDTRRTRIVLVNTAFRRWLSLTETCLFFSHPVW